MAEESLNRIEFPKLPFLCAAVLSTVVTIWLAWSSLHAHQVAETAGIKSAAFERIKGRITHLDEVLTTSARMAAATGDLQWEERYRRAEPELDTAIGEALEVGGPSIAPIAATQEANNKLIDIENRAFDLIRSGLEETASAMLLNETYKEQKRLYAQGMKDFIDQVNRQLSTELRAEREMANLSLIAACISIAFVVAVWIYVLSRVSAWHALIASAYEMRHRAASELADHRDRLEALVAERTAKVKAQAEHLEQALKAQIEYSELQHEFVSMASHEFRTPLTIIDASAQRINRKLDKLSGAQILKSIGDIRSAVKRMIGLIESTLSAEQLEAGRIKFEPEAADLTALLQEVQSRQQEISPSHRIELELRDLPVVCSGDPRLLEQVFTNLLSNAVKYAPDRPRILVKAWRDEDRVRVSVSDEGLGIPAEQLPRVFQRFFRASTAIGIAGTGIGLNVVQQFVEMHGGTIAVESAEGVGTTFTVSLPITAAGQPDRNATDSAWAEPGSDALSVAS